EAENLVQLARPVVAGAVGFERPTPRMAEPLAFCKIELAAPQSFLSLLALDPLRDRVGNRCDRVENGFRKLTTREQRHHSDQPLLDNQRVSGEGNHSVRLCPSLIIHAWIVDNVIREMRLLLPGNQPDLQVSNGNPAV